VARKTVIDKIAAGAGLEDPEVRKYITDQKKKADARMERYNRIRELTKQLDKEPPAVPKP